MRDAYLIKIICIVAHNSSLGTLHLTWTRVAEVNNNNDSAFYQLFICNFDFSDSF